MHRALKTVDFAVQVLLAGAVFWLWSTADEETAALFFYAVIGFWHALSCFYWGILAYRPDSLPGRRAYEKILVGFFLAFVLSLLLPVVGVLVAGLLLLCSPFLAVWYFLLTAREVRLAHRQK